MAARLPAPSSFTARRSAQPERLSTKVAVGRAVIDHQDDAISVGINGPSIPVKGLGGT